MQPSEQFASTNFKDAYPFVIAGRYVATTLAAGNESVNLWTRRPQNPEALRQPSEALVRTIQAYDSTFGARPKILTGCGLSSAPTWPAASPARRLIFPAYLRRNEKTSAKWLRRTPPWST